MLQLFFRIAIVLLALVITACVTTNEQSSTLNKKKAHDTHVNLGLTYLQKDNRAAARRHLEKALKLDSDSATAHNGMGLLYQLTGENELAEKAFLKSLEEAPEFSLARLNYGRFIYNQQRYEEAFDVFAIASEDLSFDNRALALTYLGKTALELENISKAKASFEHAVNIDTKLVLPMIELAEVYFVEQNYADAKKYLDRYMELAGRTSRSLWLGIRIERIFENKDKEASYALALRNLHPYSKEYLYYKKALENSQK